MHVFKHLHISTSAPACVPGHVQDAALFSVFFIFIYIQVLYVYIFFQKMDYFFSSLDNGVLVITFLPLYIPIEAPRS